MNINKIYGKKTIDNLEQEYEELNLVDLVKMKFTLQAHAQAVIQLIKKKKGGKVKTVNYTYEKQRRQYDH
jgi:helix-turn-helix protein